MKSIFKSSLWKGLLVFSLVLMAFFGWQHSTLAYAATENSIQMVSIDEVAYDHITYTVSVEVTPEFAADGYGIGIEYSTTSTFPQDSRQGYVAMDWSGTSDYSAESGTIQITRYSVNLVPQTHYWIRPLLFGSGNSGNSPDVVGPLQEFDGPSDDDSYTELTLNQPVVLSSCTGSWLHGKFTAPEKGFYALAGYSAGYSSDFDFVCYNMPQAMGYGTTGKGQNNHSNPLPMCIYLPQNQTVYFFAYSRVPSDTVKVVQADEVMPQMSVDVPMYARNAPVAFIAQNAGWYDFHFYDEMQVQGNIRTLDLNSGSWNWIGMRFVQYFEQGEKLYIRPENNSLQNGDVNPLVVSQTVMPAADSIEGGAAFNVSNVSAVFPTRMSLTETTARNGYRFGILYGEGSDPSQWHDWVRSGPPKYNTVYSWTNWSHTGKFFPGQSIYYQAAIFDANSNAVIARDVNVYQLNLQDNVNGMTQLQKDQPFTWNTTNFIPFYFTAPADGMYAVSGTGMISSRLAAENNQFLGVLSEQDSYLMGGYAKAGQKLYINVFNDMANNCSIMVTDGFGKLPSVSIGTSLDIGETAPVSFQAQETANYRFTLDSTQAELLILDEEGNWQSVGSEFETLLTKDQILWVRRAFSGNTGSVTLTVEKSSELTTLIFPSSLTTLQDEACMGLPVQRAVFSSGIQSIGNLAFAECVDLAIVEIPNGSATIATDAFYNCAHVTIIAPAGSQVETFVNAHNNLSFQAIGS